jgi:hypothetical protein
LAPFPEYGFNTAFDPGYPGGQEWPNYAQPVYVPVQAPPPVQAPQSLSAPAPAAPKGAESSTPAAELRLYRTPAPPPDTNDDHPPLIALKNGWAYTVVKYWRVGKTFHFITTQADHMQVPTTMVERIYPPIHASQGTTTKAASAH